MSDSTRKSDRHYAIGKKNPNLPFHPAVRAGDYIFVSGQVPKDENNDMIDGTIEVETLATLKTIERVIAHEGATLADVVKITTYLQDVRDFGRYNRAFTAAIGDAVMARTTVEARAVINTKIEMDAIVYRPLPADKG
ncbi:MAG: RidA family protein [Rhizobiaceae bacterium]|nr:RidA family protein [Rhizobiaceae bacterium]